MATRRGPLSPSDPLLENALALDTLYNRRAQQDRQADSDARAAEELRLQQEHSARQQQIFEANRVQQERINKEHDDAVAKQLDTETRLAAAYAGVKDIDMTRRDAGQQLAQWKTFLAGRADPAQSRELFERHEEALKMFDYRRQKELAPLGINDFEYTKGPDGHERIDEAKTAEAVTRRKQSIQAEQKAWTPDENRLHTYMAGGELYGQLPPAIIHDIVEGSSKARYLLEWARENGVVITDTDMYGTDKIPGMAKELQPPGVKKTDTTWDIGLGNITATLYDLKKVQAFLADKNRGPVPAGTVNAPKVSWLDHIKAEEGKKYAAAQAEEASRQKLLEAQVSKTAADARLNTAHAVEAERQASYYAQPGAGPTPGRTPSPQGKRAKDLGIPVVAPTPVPGP